MREELAAGRELIGDELGSQGVPDGVETAHEDSVTGPVAWTVPAHHEPPVGRARQARQVLAAVGVRVELELAADAAAEAVEALALDVGARRVVVPDDDEVAGGIGGYERIELVSGSVGVGLELGTNPVRGTVEALPENTPVAAVLGVAVPHDHEAAAPRQRDRWVPLVAGGVAVDLELGAGCAPVGGEALAKDADAGAILAGAAPEHYDAAVWPRGRRQAHGGGELAADREAVHPELQPAESARRVVALAKNAEVGAILAEAVPDDREVAIFFGGDGRGVLEAKRVRVDPDLAARLNLRRREAGYHRQSHRQSQEPRHGPPNRYS